MNPLTFGVCYYPEHWPETLWRSDLERMRAAGITVIRVAEFAWNLFEPREGVFTFDFFDRFLALVSTFPEIRVIFCTPTATPPAWLTENIRRCSPRTSTGGVQPRDAPALQLQCSGVAGKVPPDRVQTGGALRFPSFDHRLADRQRTQL
jgi:hypothetical protein